MALLKTIAYVAPMSRNLHRPAEQRVLLLNPAHVVSVMDSDLDYGLSKFSIVWVLTRDKPFYVIGTADELLAKLMEAARLH